MLIRFYQVKTISCQQVMYTSLHEGSTNKARISNPVSWLLNKDGIELNILKLQAFLQHVEEQSFYFSTFQPFRSSPLNFLTYLEIPLIPIAREKIHQHVKDPKRLCRFHEKQTADIVGSVVINVVQVL